MGGVGAPPANREDTMAISITDENDVTHALPTRWSICGACDGHGRSSAYLGSFTGEDLRDDPDFAEDYMVGHYDRACEACGGSGKVEEVDRRRADPELLKAYDKEREADREYAAERHAEWLHCGGWREMGWR
jgi:hypothetical protein